MSGSYPSQLNPGNLIQTTFSWSTQEIQSLNVNPELKRLLVQLNQHINNIVLALNVKDTGLYTEEEFLTGNQYPPASLDATSSAQGQNMQQSFRKVINFGMLPDSTSKPVPHNISGNFIIVKAEANATQPGAGFLTIPYSSTVALNQNITISGDKTNITITTGINRTSYTICYVTLEYLKQ